MFSNACWPFVNGKMPLTRDSWPRVAAHVGRSGIATGVASASRHRRVPRTLRRLREKGMSAAVPVAIRRTVVRAVEARGRAYEEATVDGKVFLRFVKKAPG